MHPGRHDHQPQRPVDRLRQTHLGVGHELPQGGDQPIGQDHQHGDAEDCENHQLERGVGQGLDRMVAHPGRGVDDRVGMVRTVQPPQPGRAVEQGMAQIGQQVDQQEGDDDQQPSGQP
ncbi:hypothetical protein D3C87_1685340 [compost metagenome]